MADEVLPSVQVIDGAGEFNPVGLDTFVRKIKLSECGLSYAVVAIMGPQSSGKSTLLNNLFGTKFVEMDAFRGRSQTTQGIWMSVGADINPCTIICDVEGTDGRERGEDDTTFEKQSALFALAVADVVLVNMWCHDIGREQAANKPLLKTVFQVMMRLFTPRKTTLLFVIRDKTRTPLETLEPILRQDIDKIWDGVAKPSQYTSTPLSEFFNIEVTALSNYEEKEEKFREEVALLRDRFQDSIYPGKIAGDRRGVIPGTGFPISIQEIWRVIKENKDLDLPAHKVMVATVRCEEIVREKMESLTESDAWKALDEGARNGIVTGFGKQASALLKQCFTLYDSEAAYFDEGVRSSKRQFMVAQARELLQPAHAATISHHRQAAIDRFKSDLEAETGGKEGSAVAFTQTSRGITQKVLVQFDEAIADAQVSEVEWDTAKAKEKLKREIEAHTEAIKSAKLLQICDDAQKEFSSALVESMAPLLEFPNSKTWPKIRKLLGRETESVHGQLEAAVHGFELDASEVDEMKAELVSRGREAIVKKMRDEANQALMHMKERFNTIFSRDADALPRRWTGSEDLRSITRDARSAALQLLSVLAAVRLEEGSEDDIQDRLLHLLADAEAEPAEGRELEEMEVLHSPKLTVSKSLARSAWPKVAAEDTILSPVQCRTIWRQFKAETEYAISQAMQAQEAHQRGNSWLPPPWAIVAMIILGFNEAMTVIRNPLLFLTLAVIYFVLRAIWVQLDVSADFEHGLVPGLVAVSAKLLPTLIRIMKAIADEIEAHMKEHGNKPAEVEQKEMVPLNELLSESESSSTAIDRGSEANLRHRPKKDAA